jgi:hypothetical protein
MEDNHRQNTTQKLTGKVVSGISRTLCEPHLLDFIVLKYPSFQIKLQTLLQYYEQTFPIRNCMETDTKEILQFVLLRNWLKEF